MNIPYIIFIFFGSRVALVGFLLLLLYGLAQDTPKKPVLHKTEVLVEEAVAVREILTTFDSVMNIT